MEFNLADLSSASPTPCPSAPRSSSGEHRRTYAELDAPRPPASPTGSPASASARGDHVGLCLRNTVEHLEAMLACYKSRAVPINVN